MFSRARRFLAGHPADLHWQLSEPRSRGVDRPCVFWYEVRRDILHCALCICRKPLVSLRCTAHFSSVSACEGKDDRHSGMMDYWDSCSISYLSSRTSAFRASNLRYITRVPSLSLTCIGAGAHARTRAA